jgi:uncharacterized membrane protein
MGRLKFGTNFALFVLFFGVALLDAFQSGNWIRAIFWVAIGVTFIIGDNMRAKKQ